MRGADFDATMLVQAVKGLPLKPKQYATVKIGNAWRRIDHTNADLAMQWFAEWAASKINTPGPKVLIPIPGSSTLIGDPPSFRTARIADAIAAASNRTVTVAPILRFRQAMQPSRSGGSRDPQVIYDNLRTIGNLPVGEVILVDDVVTSSAHLKAAAWELDDQGIEPVFAIACGRTCHEQLNDPFMVPDEEICLDIP